MTHKTTNPLTDSLPTGSTIGILGGGQLGRMLALAAAKLGMRTHIYCPDPDSPAVWCRTLAWVIVALLFLLSPLVALFSLAPLWLSRPRLSAVALA